MKGFYLIMNKASLTTFGKKVKIRLIELNMTQIELSKKLNINPKYLHLILIGKRSGEKYINSIRKLLNISND